MSRGFGLFTASAFACMIGTASAAGLSGAVEEIDVASGTMVVAGTAFLVSSETMGPGLEELKEGEVVEVVYSPKGGSSQDAFAALLIRRQALPVRTEQ